MEVTILITPKLSKENKLSSGSNNVSFENDKIELEKIFNG